MGVWKAGNMIGDFHRRSSSLHETAWKYPACGQLDVMPNWDAERRRRSRCNGSGACHGEQGPVAASTGMGHPQGQATSRDGCFWVTLSSIYPVSPFHMHLHSASLHLPFIKLCIEKEVLGGGTLSLSSWYVLILGLLLSLIFYDFNK